MVARRLVVEGSGGNGALNVGLLDLIWDVGGRGRTGGDALHPLFLRGWCWTLGLVYLFSFVRTFGLFLF